MTLQRLWTNIDTMPGPALAARLLGIFGILAVVCAVAVAWRWVRARW